MTAGQDRLDQLFAAWRGADYQNVGRILREAARLTPEAQVDLFRADQRERWERGHRVLAEAYLQLDSGLAGAADALLDLLYGELLLREEFGEQPEVEEYVERFPRLEDPLRRQFRVHRGVEGGDDAPGTRPGGGVASC